MNTKFAYPCLKCSHSEVIDFANPPKTCSKCGEPLPKLELPVETTLPTTEKGV
jgi:DNA polymerase III alpha subunit (gram-positive type)